MALKYRYADKGEIPEGLSAHYTEKDGAFVLAVDGVVEKTKLDEFRSANVALLKERDDLVKRFEGIDPDEVRKLAEEKRKLEEERQLKAGEFDKVLDQRLKALKEQHTKQLESLNAEREALNSRLSTIQIDQGVVAAATKRGLRPTAIPDITARARSVFRLVDGQPRAFEPDGKTVRYGKDGVTPMTLEEWVDGQTSDAPHLFESNAGGGAAGTPAGGGTGSQRSVRNPFRKETWNLTEQMRLTRTDPALASRLRAAA
jgi:hypothetical protein